MLNLKIWGHLPFDALLHGRSFHITLTFPYIFLFVHCFKWALIGTKEGGVNFKIYPTCMFQMSLHWPGGLILRFTPVNLKIFLWYLHVYSMRWYFFISSYYLTVFKWVLTDCIEKCRVHSVLWQFWRGVNLKIYSGKSENLPLVSTCFLYALVSPYIFLLFDCFEWALIDCI